MTSSADKHHHPPLSTPYGTIAAPPPTPSTQPNLLSTSEAADTLSLLLNRLPPSLSLSLPSRRHSLSATSSSTTTAVSPTLISLSDPTSTLHSNLLAAAQLGFFQLTHHSISSQLASSAEADCLSLFNLPPDKKQQLFVKNWPFGYDANDDDDSDDESAAGESFILDSDFSNEPTELDLVNLKEFSREMEKLGLEVVEALACAVGFKNPAKVDPTRICSQMWISHTANNNNKASYPRRFYPYVVGLQYQIRCQKYSILTDSGWVSAVPQLDSVLVTIGDIAQVWSNGKLKKVRGGGAAVASSSSSSSAVDGSSSSAAEQSTIITMSQLITLPVESMVSPMMPISEANDEEEDEDEWVFNSFSFEDYAWRLYHQRRLLLKDPLLRYRRL